MKSDFSSESIIFRFYEEFPINLKTGEANLTQIYLQVAEGWAGQPWRGGRLQAKDHGVSFSPGGPGLH